MNYKIKFSTIFLLVAGATGGLFAEPVVPATFTWRTETTTAFGPGEFVKYVIKYGFIPSGFATLEIPAVEEIQGRPAFHILSTAFSNKTIDVFFKVRDRNESWLDVNSLCSLRFVQDIHEGRYVKVNKTDFDHAAGKFIHRHRGRKSVEDHISENDFPRFAQDALSCLYYIRAKNLAPGEKYFVDVNSGGKNWKLEVKIGKIIENIRVPAGKFRCFKVEPVMAGEGIFMANGKLEVWMTADRAHVPVLLRSRVMVGAFDAEMLEYRPGKSGPADPTEGGASISE